MLATAQVPAERPFKIITLHPALRKMIAPDAKLETLGNHFGLTEGPVWVQHGDDGYLLFSDNAGARAALGLPAEQRLHGQRSQSCRRANGDQAELRFC